MDRREDPADLRRLPTGELVKELAEEVSNLVRAELDLAKAELTEKSKRAGIGLGELGAAGIVALYALGDRRRMILYVAAAVATLTLTGTHKLWASSAGSVAWLALIAGSAYAAFAVIWAARRD